MNNCREQEVVKDAKQLSRSHEEPLIGILLEKDFSHHS